MTLALKLVLGGEPHDAIPKVMHLEDVLTTNAFDIFFDDPKAPAGLFLTMSRLNHSCVPNADHFYDDKSGCKSVVANRDIDAGAEITIAYIDHCKPRVQRQVELRTWGFVGQCAACDVRHPDSRAHEQRLKVLAQLYQDPCMDNSGHLMASVCRSKTMLERAAEKAQRRIQLLTEHQEIPPAGVRNNPIPLNRAFIVVNRPGHLLTVHVDM